MAENSPLALAALLLHSAAELPGERSGTGAPPRADAAVDTPAHQHPHPVRLPQELSLPSPGTLLDLHPVQLLPRCQLSPPRQLPVPPSLLPRYSLLQNYRSRSRIRRSHSPYQSSPFCASCHPKQ